MHDSVLSRTPASPVSEPVLGGRSDRRFGQGLFKALRRVGPQAILVQAAGAILGIAVVGSLRPGYFPDFYRLREVAQLYLEGTFSHAYPAPAALLMTPFALIPYSIAKPVFLVLLIGSIPATLRVLGVRDWRCYVVVFTWAPVFAAVNSGALTALLLLALAAAWRYRDRWLVAGVLVAALIAVKLFLAPVALWLAATRRWKAAGTVAVASLAAACLAWSVVGFEGVTRYPAVVRTAVEGFQADAYTPLAFALALGASESIALGLTVLLGGTTLAAGLLLGRRRFELASLTIVLFGTLLLTPTVWAHYFVLLTLPIAAARPRLSALWFFPLAFWAIPMLSGGDPLLIATGVGIAAVITAAVALAETGVPFAARLGRAPQVQPDPTF